MMIFPLLGIGTGRIAKGLRGGVKTSRIARWARQWPPRALAVLLASFSCHALAGYLDDVEVQTEGKQVVVRVRFNIGVQHLRHVPEKQGDTLQIFLRQLSADVPPPVSEESRTIAENDAVPRIVVTYPFQNGSPTKRLSVNFNKPVQFRVRQGIDPHSIEIVLQAAAVAKPAPPAVPAAPVTSGKFAIYLDTHDTIEAARGAPLVPQLSRYQVLLSKSVIAETELYDRNIGFFDTKAAAEVTRDRIVAMFPGARVVDVSGETMLKVEPKPSSPPRQPAAVATVPAAGAPPVATLPVPGTPAAKMPGSKTAAAPVPAPAGPAEIAAPAATAAVSAATPEVERQAIEAMAKGRNAFAGEKWDEAIDLFNQLLMLPPNSQSAPAQELAGLARERNGQLAKAKAEYESYLSLYPNAEGAPRIRERLALLEKRLVPGEKGAQQAERAAGPTETRTVFGSLSQYYYSGKTKPETAFNTPTTVDQATLTSQDLSSVVTAADVTARFQSDKSDLRLVLRGNDSHSLIDRNPSRSRLDAAYLDYRGLQNPFTYRLGRQVGSSGGIFGRFDGAVAGYRFARNWRINVEAGVPVDYSLDSKRRFAGLSLDVENLFKYWNGNTYVIRQTVDGIADREAVGGEIRYFKDGNSLYATLDYDTLFKKLNVATIQGSVLTSGQTTYTLLYDQRKAPPLSVTNAIFGQPVSSIEELLKTRTEAQLREQAVATTAQVKQVMASVTTPVNSRWQLGADYRLTNVGALPAYENIPESPSTGNIHGVTLQTIGSNLYSRRDINVFSFSWLKSPTYHGEYLSYSNLSGFGEKWTLEPSLRAYSQVDNMDSRSRRYTAVLRISYALKQSLSLEGEYDVEKSITQSALQNENALHEFFYLGYRYTF